MHVPFFGHACSGLLMLSMQIVLVGDTFSHACVNVHSLNTGRGCELKCRVFGGGAGVSDCIAGMSGALVQPVEEACDLSEHVAIRMQHSKGGILCRFRLHDLDWPRCLSAGCAPRNGLRAVWPTCMEDPVRGHCDLHVHQRGDRDAVFTWGALRGVQCWVGLLRWFVWARPGRMP